MPRIGARRLLRRTALLAVAMGLTREAWGATPVMPPQPAPDASPAAGQGAAPALPTVERVRINPTRRTLRFIVPLTDGPTYLGDVDLAVSPNDDLSVAAPRFLQLLEPLLTDAALEPLRQAAARSPDLNGTELGKQGIVLVYDSQRLALYIVIPVGARRPRNLTLRGVSGERAVTLEPAHLSGYVNIRASADAVYNGPEAGVLAPIAGIDGAVRLGGVVAEGEGYASARSGEPGFRRAGTRLLYDDLRRDMRWIAGDLQPAVRAFQSAPSLGGLSVSRLYSELQPQRQVRSTGAQSFTIAAPGTVEIFVNGRSVERRRMQPGTYSLSDFPLADGANDVQLVIEDDTGARRSIDFSLFSDRSLLEPGLTEFAANAGMLSRPTRAGLDYSGHAIASGFIRRGLSPQWTAGFNAQGDARTQQAGLEMLFGSRLGLIGLDLAASHRRDGRKGVAAAATYQLLRQGQDGFRSQSLRASVEYRSRDFAIVSDYALTLQSSRRLAMALSYNNVFGRDRYFGADIRYARQDSTRPQDLSIRGLFGIALTSSTRLDGQAEYHRFDRRDVALVRIGIVHRFGQRGQARAELTSRGQVQASWQDSGGQGVGAWSLSADADRTGMGTTANLGATYLANRAEIGLSHVAAWRDADQALDQRSSVRVGTSIAFADGVFAVGRPITDSFLIGVPHASLKDKALRLDPQQQGETARSGQLGPGLVPDLSPYSDRTVTYDVPDAPSGYDLGQGNVQIHAPHRSGYRMVVGSDYHLLVFGKLIDSHGEPISLLAGKAIDLRNPRKEPLMIFTGRNGKFGMQGMRPGRWCIEMPTEPPTIFEFDVGEGTNDVFQLGEVRAVEMGGGRK